MCGVLSWVHWTLAHWKGTENLRVFKCDSAARLGSVGSCKGGEVVCKAREQCDSVHLQPCTLAPNALGFLEHLSEKTNTQCFLLKEGWSWLGSQVHSPVENSALAYVIDSLSHGHHPQHRGFPLVRKGQGRCICVHPNPPPPPIF